MSDYNNIPKYLKINNRFCCWLYELRKGYKTKVPYDPVTRSRASPDNPSTFWDFATALQAVEIFDGIGFLVGNGVCAIDIDHCFDENDNLSPLAQDIVRLFPGSYIERSPSGKGLRIIFLASGFKFDKIKYYINNRKIGVEVYVSGATNRYVTVTGNVYQAGGVIDQSASLQIVCDKFMQRPLAKISYPRMETVTRLVDEDVIRKAMQAKNGEAFRLLWEGDTSKFPSPSEADLSMANKLAFWCGRDIEQMDRLFRQSKLMRDKFDRPQSGSTYGQLLLAKAAAEANNVYSPFTKESPADDFTDAANPEAVDPEVWEELIPIDTITPPEFPLDCFPETIGKFAAALSEYTQTDPAMAGVILLGLLGTLFQKKYSIKSINGNVEQLSIFSLAIALPAERKSEILKYATKPLHKFEMKYNMEHRTDLSRLRAQKKMLQKTLIQAEKGDNPEALYQAQEEYDNFREPQPLTLMADDTTVEALVSLMKDNGERMLICSDEGGVFTHMKGRYKQNGDDTELYLKAHSGGRVSVHRKSREPDILEKPALSMCIAVQPFVVENSILDEENSGRGLTARFVYAYCQERAGSRRAISTLIPKDIEEAYEEGITKCLDLTINSGSFVDYGYHMESVINLSDEAREFAIDYFSMAENRIVEGLERAKGWNGKAFGLTMRIAGLFHTYEFMEQGEDPSRFLVPEWIMQNAAVVTEVLAVHAEKVFMGTERKNNDAIYLLGRIKAMAVDEFKKQDLWQKSCKRLQTAEVFDEALKILESHKYIKVETIPTKGRPMTMIKVNPLVKYP